MDKNKKVTIDFSSPLVSIKNVYQQLRGLKDFPKTRVSELINNPMDIETKKELSSLLFGSISDIDEYTIKYKLLERSKNFFAAEEYNMLVRKITKQKLSK